MGFIPNLDWNTPEGKRNIIVGVGLALVVLAFVIYFMARSEGAISLTKKEIKRYAGEHAPSGRTKAGMRSKARREGFRTRREAAKLSMSATGKGRGQRSEGFSSGELMGNVYGVTAGADGTYDGYDPSSDFGGCDGIDGSDKANVDASNFQELIRQGQLAYGPDVIRNHERWVEEVAPWSQTAAISPDELGVDEMRAAPLLGIAAWTRTGPEVTGDALFVPEQDHDDHNDAALDSAGVIGDPSTDVPVDDDI